MRCTRCDFFSCALPKNALRSCMRLLCKTLCITFMLLSQRGLALEALLEHHQGDGVGYRKHYSKVGIYHAFEKTSWQPFIDLRYLILESGKPGGNLGGGLGYQFQKKNRLSLYSFFDLTTSKSGYLFNQVMGGISYTHPFFFSNRDWGELAIYANAYFPLKSLEKALDPFTFSRFRGNYALLCQTDRFALTGGNLEIGYRSKQWENWSFYLAGSGYYFKRSVSHAFGGLGKFRLIYRDIISMEVAVTGDRLFGTNVIGSVGVRIPLGKKEMRSVKDRCYHLYRSRPVERFEPIVLKKERREVVARDPEGSPFYFLFVNNLSGSDGTFEDPFPTLAQAEMASAPTNIIYVFPGDNTTRGMDKGITLKPHQTLIGSGSSLPLLTDRGPVTIPAQTATRPQLSNTDPFDEAKAVVITADGCCVRGIDAVNASNAGFLHQFTDGSISTAKFSECRAINCAAAGFRGALFQNSKATLFFDQCVATKTSLVVNAANGFQLRTNSNSELTCHFNECQATENIRDGFQFDSFPSVSRIDATMSRCTASGNQIHGIDILSELDSVFNASITDCIFVRNGENGARSSIETNPSQTINWTNCIFSQNGLHGLAIETQPGSTVDNTVCTYSCNQCEANENGASAFFVVPNGTGLVVSPAQMQVFFTDCSARDNQNPGFLVNSATSTGLSGSLLNGFASGNAIGMGDNNFSIDSVAVTIMTSAETLTTDF